jgi:hypothetical protein
LKVQAGSAFEIDDGTGRALVMFPAKPVLVYSSMPASHHLEGQGWTIPEDLRRLAAHAGALAGRTADTIEGDEAIVTDGEVITIGGHLSQQVRADAPADSYRSARLRWIIASEPLILVKDEHPRR